MTGAIHSGLESSATARERMQDSAAYRAPLSHHLQQTVYIDPPVAHPERSQATPGRVAPEQARYQQERTTRPESFAATPHYAL